MLLPREWLEDEWSAINESVSSALIFTPFTQPFLTGVILEVVKMSSERYCFSELEKYIMPGTVSIAQNYFGT